MYRNRINSDMSFETLREISSKALSQGHTGHANEVISIVQELHEVELIRRRGDI